MVALFCIFLKDLKVNIISVCKQGTVALITFEIPGVAVQTSDRTVRLPVLGNINLPHIVMMEIR